MDDCEVDVLESSLMGEIRLTCPRVSLRTWIGVILKEALLNMEGKIDVVLPAIDIVRAPLRDRIAGVHVS